MLMVPHVGIQVQTEHIFACANWWYRMRSYEEQKLRIRPFNLTFRPMTPKSS